MIFAGFGDSVDETDPCALNPNDPVCTTFYGGKQAAAQAAVGDTSSQFPTAPPPPSFDFTVGEAGTCPPGTTWADSAQRCFPDSAAGPNITASIPGASSFAASLPKLGLGWAIGLAVMGAIGYGGYRIYKKRK